MERKDVVDFLMEIMEMEDEQLAEETTLSDISQWDSLARLSMLADAEDRFGKEITPAQVKSFTTVKEIVDYFVN